MAYLNGGVFTCVCKMAYMHNTHTKVQVGKYSTLYGPCSYLMHQYLCYYVHFLMHHSDYVNYLAVSYASKITRFVMNELKFFVVFFLQLFR